MMVVDPNLTRMNWMRDKICSQDFCRSVHEFAYLNARTLRSSIICVHASALQKDRECALTV